MNKYVIFLLLIGLAAIMTTGTVSAADTYVNGSVSASGDGNSWETAYKTIQEGVNGATDGNTAYIASGTYTGDGNKNIEIREDITIQGSGIDQTIIDLENNGRAFLNLRCGTQSSFNIKDLTIQNANSDSGGAIINYGNLTVTNTKFISNTANNGGVIYNMEGICTVSGSTFTGNTANSGGAIYIEDGTAVITDSTFEKNTAGDGGAIEVWKSTLTVTSSKFIDNIAINFGGAIDTILLQTALVITKSVFTGNTAGVAGAIFSIGTLEISDSTFDYNTARYGGGALVTGWLNPSKIMKSTFTSNSAPYDAAIGTNGNIIIIGSNFYNNHATIDGGAIGISSGDGGNVGYLKIKYSRFIGNTAGTTPQDIYLHYQSAAAPTINLDAKLNWWGTNTGPEVGRIDADGDRIPNSDSYSPWLILSTTANPTSTYPGESSLITADLYTDSNGGNHQTDAASYPAKIPVKFTTNLGTLNNNGQTVDTTLNSGKATVTLKSTSPGTAQATTQVDNQATTTTVTIMTPQQSTTIINEAVQDLPATVFSKNADQQKNTLNNMFNAVNNMINDANYKGAIKKLEQIKITINSLNLDPTNKTELNKMIDDLIAYLKTLI